MTKHYDFIALGSGTAAQAAALQVGAAGRTVAVIDFRPFGGTCALRGCNPKKMLVGATSAVDHLRRMRAQGVVGEARIDWPALMAFKRTFTDGVPQAQERLYESNGIDIFHGTARFAAKNSVEIGGMTLEGEHFLIAVGAEPVKLNIPGEEHIVTSEQFLALDALPRRIVLIGGGYICAEFSHIAALAGAHVTVLQRGARMLKAFDADAVEWLMAKFQSLGIDVRTSAAVERIERTETGFRVFASHGPMGLMVEADLVVHAAGRAPRLDVLALEAAGVELENGRVKLNDFLQSVSNPAVYAAGDAAQNGPPLTPVSSHDGRVAAANILRGNHLRPNYRGVPSVAFTQPPIAKVGISEEEARERCRKFRLKTEKTSTWFTARQAGEPVYGFKTLVEEGTELILGAHIVGPAADEVINVFAFAIRHGLTAAQIKDTMFAYPTGASDIGYML